MGCGEKKCKNPTKNSLAERILSLNFVDEFIKSEKYIISRIDNNKLFLLLLHSLIKLYIFCCWIFRHNTAMKSTNFENDILWIARPCLFHPCKQPHENYSTHFSSSKRMNGKCRVSIKIKSTQPEIWKSQITFQQCSIYTVQIWMEIVCPEFSSNWIALTNVHFNYSSLSPNLSFFLIAFS